MSESLAGLLGGNREALVPCVCSWSCACPLQRCLLRGKGPPLQSGEDSSQPLGLQRPPDEEREAEGGPQGQEAHLIEEGMWRVSVKTRRWIQLLTPALASSSLDF